MLWVIKGQSHQKWVMKKQRLETDDLGQGWRTFFGERAKILKIMFGKLMPCHYIKHNEFIVIKQISMRLYRMVLQRSRIQI